MSKVKENWDDSSDEEDIDMTEGTDYKPIGTNYKTDGCQCFVCSCDEAEIRKYISNKHFYPQCENKTLLSKMKELELTECHDKEEYDEEEEYDEDEYDEDEYDEDEYDDECDKMDKKTGNYVMCR
jgi:hypothetical protein